MRASASYRSTVAKNLLLRFGLEASGAPRTRVLEIA
jgi:xanthine dehydrogenase small subunit